MARRATGRHPGSMTTHPQDLTPPRRLRRSTTDTRIAGVAGGLAEHLSLDPTVVRLGFALSILFGGTGVLAYLVLWALVPSEDAHAPPEARPAPA
jgi:phage shock protein PspC (stress-responsive transcriptional regulator)